MRFGVCMPIEQAEFIAKLGFDYLEVSAAGLAEMTEAQFADFLQKNEAAPIHAEAANCMFPGSIKLTGDNVDFEAIQTYVNHAIGRLAQAGIKIGVFGSGGSRRVPENFPREKAWEQLKTVAKILGDAGEKYGVTKDRVSSDRRCGKKCSKERNYKSCYSKYHNPSCKRKGF